MTYSSIERKNNTCNVEGCGKPSGTWLKCTHHRSLEYAERSKKKRELNGVTQDKLDLWYQKIYDMHFGICAETGRKLSFDKKYCCHILPKKNGIGGFPYFKLDLRNGILLSWNIHHVIDQGSPEQRKALKTWEYISMVRKQLLEEVGIEYNEDYWLNYKT